MSFSSSRPLTPLIRIRKAYRRKALELHPDKNIDNVDYATARFAEVQTAYEILSDPQERAWYDSHKDAILHGEEVDESGQDPSYFRNVKVTSAEDIVALVGRFNATMPFTDEPTGFYGSLRELFDQLAAEEAALGDHTDRDPVSYPAFGESASDYDAVVRPFYNGWAGFSTRKTFSWKDKYRLPDAPDRRVRRAMEKENKKCREEAAREFNDSVRFLVGFARKRDPRYVPNTQSQADRQKALRDIVAAQKARSRAANQEKMGDAAVADWVQAGREDAAVEGSFDSEAESDVEHIECVVCNKVFKSENQYNAHERSKKHLKAVQHLRREMRKENKDLDLENSANQQGLEDLEEESPSSPEPGVASDVPDSPVAGKESSEPIAEPTQDDEAKAERPVSPSELPSSATRDTDEETPMTESLSSLAIDEEAQGSKVGKAKARRAKKAAREAAPSAASDSQGMSCQVCGEGFSSRSKLFTHIREKKHAALRQQLPHEVAKKKKRSGKG